jgi:hypothetical protein
MASRAGAAGGSSDRDQGTSRLAEACLTCTLGLEGEVRARDMERLAPAICVCVCVCM